MAEREKELLNQVSRLAGRINKHKQTQLLHEISLLDQVTKLAHRIENHKKQQKTPNIDVEQRPQGVKRAREEQQSGMTFTGNMTCLCHPRLALRYFTSLMAFLPRFHMILHMLSIVIINLN